MTSLPTQPLRPVLGTALGLLTAATLTAPGALAAPVVAAVPAETTTPAPSASGTTSATPTGGGTGSSAAAEGYRFWGFFQQKNGKWEFAQSGAFQVVPAEGAVDGWRFATASIQDTRAPRAQPSFDDVCGKVPGEAGKKRVAVVIDYGRKADAGNEANPPAAIARCANVPSGASSEEILNAVAGPREDKGMVCAIDGWPNSSACGDPVAKIPDDARAADDKVDISVSAPREQPKPQDSAPQQAADQGPSKTLLTAISVVIVALGAALAWRLSHRRRTAQAAGASAADPGVGGPDAPGPRGPGSPPERP